MAYVINNECIKCGVCVGTCPVSCISEGDVIYTIDPDVCIDCGVCVGACPVSAIEEGK